MAWPDYAVTAIVGGLALAARMGRAVACSVGPGASSGTALLAWPSLGMLTPPGAVAALPTPSASAPQVVRVMTVAQLDALMGQLLVAHLARGGGNSWAVWELVQEAGRNALRWSADRAAFVAWSWFEDRIEVAVGDTGPGIPFVERRFAAGNVLRALLNDQRDERGSIRHGLTWMHEHLTSVPNRQGFVLSGDQVHDCAAYVESFSTESLLNSFGPTVIAARL